MHHDTDFEIDRRNILRDAAIVDAAWRIVELNGINALTRSAIAQEADVSPASVSNFGRVRLTRGEHDRIGYRERVLAAVMKRAVEKSDLRMMRIGLVDGCLSLDDVPAGLRASVRI